MAIELRLGQTATLGIPIGEGDDRVVFDTSLVEGHERLAYWSAVGRQLYGGLAFSRYISESFSGRLVVHQLGSMTMSRTDATPIAASRTVKAARSTEEGFSLRLHLFGRSTMILDDYELELQPGDLLLSDNQAAFHNDCSGAKPWANLTVTIPDGLVRPYADRLRRVSGVPISTEYGTGGIVRRMLVNLQDTLSREGVGSETSHLAQSTIELVLALFLESETSRHSHQVPPHDLLLGQVKAYIEERLANPELHPTSIARDHFISIRLLYKLFEPGGTSPVQWIRERRVERCRRDLADPGLAHQTVARIAANWGFEDPAYFSRLFRARIGVSPREFRTGAGTVRT